jgi:ATP-dependent DNA helicase DinG
MTTKTEREISRNVPRDIQIRTSDNIVPLFTAYGCVLMERDTGRSFIYTAVNLKNGKREVISRRQSPLLTSGVDAMVEKIRLSNVAGAGVMEADRPFGDGLALGNCRDMLNTLFKEIYPQHGYAIRKEQIDLAHHILDAINKRTVSLAEAEVGTGKTLAYLTAAILAKRGRLNGYWNMSFYTGTPYVDLMNMPIVIATSSIALQRAIVKDYIPALSDILLEHGVIKTPLTTALRKGREHYICERNLRSHLPFERNPSRKQILESLTKPTAPIDLAEIDGLTPYVKRKISVPDRCDKNCPNRDDCAYLRFRKNAESSDIDIQVCNHNYLLADTLRRRDGKRELIPNYQMIIIDEAHKFLQAARSMYGTELTSLSLSDIKDSIAELNLKNEDAQMLARWEAKKLFDENNSLFRGLLEASMNDDTDEEPDRFGVVFDYDAARHLRNIRDISGRLIELLVTKELAGNGKGRKAQLLWELEQVRDQAATFAQYNDLICWLEKGNEENRLCAIPKDLDVQLYDDLWCKGIPTILTSGTLSAGGDFSRIKRTLGIEHVGNRITETSKPSPFNFKDNALIYLSEKMPFPNQKDSNYILAAANEIERLINAAHGHAAVLFTSYKAMDMVWEQLEERGIPFPMFRLDKGGVREIERFKQSGNGVMFAAGALWEGIDIPGDALSLLIIVRLPFAVPDPISEYERSLYNGMDEYKSLVITPDMQVKLKQGAGRLIRIETDTGVIAIIDIRACPFASFHEYVLEALPDCEITNDPDRVEDFIRTVKDPEYYVV